MFKNMCIYIYIYVYIYMYTYMYIYIYRTPEGSQHSILRKPEKDKRSPNSSVA